MQRFLLSLFLLIFGLQLFAAPVRSLAELPTTSESEKSITLDDIRDLKNKALGEKLGRKLTFKEAIAFSIVRGKLKRAKKRAEKGKMAAGKTTVAEIGLISSLGGLAALTLIIILASSIGVLWILSLIGSLLGLTLGAIGMTEFKETDPKKFRRSRLAFWLGLIPIGLGIVFITAVLIIFSNSFR